MVFLLFYLERETGRQRDRETERQRERDRQTDRQTDRSGRKRVLEKGTV